MGLSIHELQKEAFATAEEKGWHDKPRTTGDLIALCHSELSEALEAHRSGESMGVTRSGFTKKPEGFVVELADCMIRILEMAEIYGLDLEYALKVKMAYNKTRPYRHGGKAL